MQKISVFGLGYVGLPSAAVFAHSGLTVTGVDIDQTAVDIINSGRAHIVEPGLDEMIANTVKSGRLKATTKAEKADVFVIAVPTPFKEGKQPDLEYVKAAAQTIAPLLEKGNLVILESTSPVGATEQVAQWLQLARPDLVLPTLDGAEGDIYLAYCPERILPGKVIRELVENDRVIGGITTNSSEQAVRFYEHVVKGECHVTNTRTAEFCKLAENSFRDVNIAFANELSMIAARLGVDVYELISLTNRHPRVNILQPGTGVGGHCIAVDPWFIVDSAPDIARIIKTAREVNDNKPKWVVQQVAAIAEGMENPVIACLGLAYKPDVDDLRESPSVDVIKSLVAMKLGRVIACEPFVEKLPKVLSAIGVEFLDCTSALSEADIVVYLTAHSQFQTIPGELIEGKKVFDACGLTR